MKSNLHRYAVVGLAALVAMGIAVQAVYAEVEDPNFLRKQELIDEIFGEDYTGNTFAADDSRIDDLISELWPAAGQQDSAPTQTASQIDKHDQRIQTLEVRMATDRDRLTEIIAEVTALAPVSVADTKRTADAAKMKADANARHVTVHSGLLTDHEKALWGVDEHGNALTMYNEDDTMRKSLIEVNADAISGQGERLAALGTGVSGNTSKIGANEDAIGVNAKSIATNEEDIAANVKTLGEHDTRISTNAEGIAANVETLEAHDERINTNAQGIASNVEMLGEHDARIDSNMEGVASNLASIESLDAELYGEAEPDEEGMRVSRIDVNEASIATNAETLGVHATALDSLGKVDVQHGERLDAHAATLKRHGEKIERAEAGAAAAMALAAIAPPAEDQMFSIGAGAGHWAGQNAVAIRGAARVQNSVISVGMAGNSDDIGGNLGVSWGW